MKQNHETTWLSNWQDDDDDDDDDDDGDDNGPSQLKQLSDTNLLQKQWMYRLFWASSISRYITISFH
jgi:hypothetical protein